MIVFSFLKIIQRYLALMKLPLQQNYGLLPLGLLPVIKGLLPSSRMVQGLLPTTGRGFTPHVAMGLLPFTGGHIVIHPVPSDTWLYITAAEVGLTPLSLLPYMVPWSRKLA